MLSFSVTCKVEGKADELFDYDHCIRINRYHLLKTPSSQKMLIKTSPAILIKTVNHISSLKQGKENLSVLCWFCLYGWFGTSTIAWEGDDCFCHLPFPPHCRVWGNCQLLDQIILKLGVCLLFSPRSCPSAYSSFYWPQTARLVFFHFSV